MIDHLWSVVCSRAVIDRETNNVSIQNALERITITGEPREDAMLPMQFTVVSSWIRANRDLSTQGRARVRYESPSGDPLLESDELAIDLSDSIRHRTIFRFRGLPVREAGYYTIRVELWSDDTGNWQDVALIPLEIVFKSPEK